MHKLRLELLADMAETRKYIKVRKSLIQSIDPDSANPIDLMTKSIADNLPQYVHKRLKRHKAK